MSCGRYCGKWVFLVGAVAFVERVVYFGGSLKTYQKWNY